MSRPLSIAGFLLVPKCQNNDAVVGSFMAVQCDVAGVAELNEEFAQFGMIADWPAQAWRSLKQRKLFGYRFGSAPRSGRVFAHQKTPAAFQAALRTFSKDYSWHLGAASSPSVPHLASQSCASRAFRCRPVS